MTTYVIATTETPTITCPPWCVVPTEDHIADLPNWDGMVIHWSSDRGPRDRGFTARLAQVATPAGVPDPTEPMLFHVNAPNELLVADAMAAGDALLALAKEAQG